MKKKLLAGLAIGVMIYGIGSGAESSPLYYTFEGVVTANSDQFDRFVTGASVTYTFLIDFSKKGTITNTDGVVEVKDLKYSNGRLQAHSFYADFVSGTVYPKDENIPPVSFLKEANYVWDMFNPNGSVNHGYIDGLTGDDELVIYSHNENVFDWQIGISVHGYQHPNSWNIFSDLTLKTISHELPSPVPEPATMILFGTGVIGLILTKFRKSGNKC